MCVENGVDVGSDVEEEGRDSSQGVVNVGIGASFKEEQKADSSLERVRGLADAGGTDSEASDRVYFTWKDGLLFRKWRPKGSEVGDIREREQLVLPKKYRDLVLRLVHDIPLGGHLGITKTKDRILERYYWPGVFQSVKQYCRTCEICQRTGSKKPPKAKLIPMPLIPKPFQRIAMDIMGPTYPGRRRETAIFSTSATMQRYILKQYPCHLWKRLKLPGNWSSISPISEYQRKY